MENKLQLCLRDNKPHVKTMDCAALVDRPVSVFFVLPRDVQDKIVRLMCNISDAIPVKVSIENAVKYYLSIKQYCPLNIGNKIYMTDDLIKLNLQQREDLIAVGSPSDLKKGLGFSHSLISNSDAQMLEAMPEYIRKDLKVDVFDARENINLVTRSFCGINMQACMMMSYIGALGNPILLSGACVCQTWLWALYGCVSCVPVCHQCVNKNCKYEKQY
jgi:hypothetical protein